MKCNSTPCLLACCHTCNQCSVTRHVYTADVTWDSYRKIRDKWWGIGLRIIVTSPGVTQILRNVKQAIVVPVILPLAIRINRDYKDAPGGNQVSNSLAWTCIDYSSPQYDKLPSWEVRCWERGPGAAALVPGNTSLYFKKLCLHYYWIILHCAAFCITLHRNILWYISLEKKHDLFLAVT